MKLCRKCNTKKVYSEFEPCAGNHDGLSAHCTYCKENVPLHPKLEKEFLLKINELWKPTLYGKSNLYYGLTLEIPQ